MGVVKHGKATSSEFNTWVKMKQRCYNPNDKGYKNYGARGISVCESWRNSFENFFKDMGTRPSRKHSIDRINNDGNYEPGNCRWATRAIQNANRRCMSACGYKGVTYRKAYKRWVAKIKIDGRTIHVGSFTCPLKAVAAYERATKLAKRDGGSDAQE